MTWWETVLVPIILTAIAMLAVEVLARWIYDQYMQPKLRIIEEDSSYKTRETIYLPSLLLSDERSVLRQRVIEKIYHSVFIKNEGKTVAKNCIGTLILLNAETSDLLPPLLAKDCFIDPSYTGKRALGGSLCWARAENPSSININAYDEALLDICRVVVKDSQSCIEIPSERGWECIRMALRLGKEYEAILRVTAENAQKVEKRIVIKPVDHNVKIEFK